MMLDLFSLQLSASTVIMVSSVVYLLETLVRNDGWAGRFWALAFLSGVFSAVCYLIWMLVPHAFVAVAVGNGAFVSATGMIWLGCVAFNGRRLRGPAIVAGVAIVAVAGAALLAGPDAGDWAGAVPLFVGNAFFAVLGAIETRRGAIGRRWSATGLTVVLAIAAVWFGARTVVFVVMGPESDLFRSAFGSETAALLTMTLVVTAVVVTSVLRASESGLRGDPETWQVSLDRQGVLMRDSFRIVLQTLSSRLSDPNDDLCVIVVRADDLRRVSLAFGPDEADAIADTLRRAVRRHAPVMSLIGERDATGLTVAFVVARGDDVSRIVRVLHDRIVEELLVVGTSVVPVIGMGAARASEDGADTDALVARADAHAARAAATGKQLFSAAG